MQVFSTFLLIAFILIYSLTEWRHWQAALESLLFKERQLEYYKQWRKYNNGDRRHHARLRHEIKVIRRFWCLRLLLNLLVVSFIVAVGTSLVLSLQP